MGYYDKRERKEFEPPPWERAEFERFQEERRQREEAAAAAAAAAESETAGQPEVAEPDGVGPQASEAATEPVEPPRADGAEEADGSQPSGLNEAQALELMLGLRAEEPSAGKQYRGLNSMVSVVLMVFGAVIVLLGLVRTVQAAGAGIAAFILGALTVFAGVIPLGSGGWLWMRNRKRG